MRRLTVPSYAKVNFTLDVLSRRPDGYHNIASVMQTVSLADCLELEEVEEPGVRLQCDAPGIPHDDTNLACRAAAAALRKSGSGRGVLIRLIKRIPVQAGLGGGSSNAAAALRGVNQLLDLGLTTEELAELASDLGSDVPFFLTGGTASVRGRGDRVTALPDAPQLWFIIAMPAVHVSTQRAYQALDALPHRVSARSTRSMEALVAARDLQRIASRMTNDFEQVVLAEEPAVAVAMDDLLMARARNARLCGSGSAVFGVAFDRSEAEEVARLLRLRPYSVTVCRSVNREEALRLGDAVE
ncbi:MAG: 4-(cytidine 5'-diphospho)-2-C-methyl-D-erythritol kinase [Chthonomonadales bacterium]